MSRMTATVASRAFRADLIYRQRPSLSHRSSSHKRQLRLPYINALEDGDQQSPPKPKEEEPKVKRTPESTDAVASFLTRRFGIGAGLAWLGILAVGSLGEQIKTRLEVKREQESTKEVQSARTVTLPSGVQYVDKKIGGGSAPYKGALVALNLRGSLEDTGDIFEDTFKSGKQIVLVFGSRPLSETICPGLEEAISTMKTGGVREVMVPADQAFGPKGTVLFPDSANEYRIPPNSGLRYVVELKRVSIAP